MRDSPARPHLGHIQRVIRGGRGYTNTARKWKKAPDTVGAENFGKSKKDPLGEDAHPCRVAFIVAPFHVQNCSSWQPSNRGNPNFPILFYGVLIYIIVNFWVATVAKIKKYSNIKGLRWQPKRNRTATEDEKWGLRLPKRGKMGVKLRYL